MVTIARIDRATSIVVNIEVADEEWLTANADHHCYLFIQYSGGGAWIGASWSQQDGFSHPPENALAP